VAAIKCVKYLNYTLSKQNNVVLKSWWGELGNYTCIVYTCKPKGYFQKIGERVCVFFIDSLDK
jgi:hypothetical protein